MTIIFNWLGLAFAVLGLVFGWAICSMLGNDSEDVIMSAGGPLTAMLDLGYRVKKRKSVWRGSQGGSLFFLPAWVFGVAWFAIGVVRLVAGRVGT